VVVVAFSEGRAAGVPPPPVGEIVPRHRLREVALGSVGPEDGPYVLRYVPSRVRRLAPGELPLDLLVHQVEFIYDLGNALFKVEGEEMEVTKIQKIIKG